MDGRNLPVSLLPYLSSRCRLILWFTLISAVIGGLYSHFHAIMDGSLLFTLDGVPRGVITATVIASVLTSLEVFVMTEPLGEPLRRASFPVHVAVKTVIYLIIILLALALGAALFPAPNEQGIELRDVLFSLAASFVFNFMFDINRLLGQNVLLNFITGRYHQPGLEERVFLFVDMEGSTGFAERLGALAFHRLLNRFVIDLTGPIVATRGQIYSYVGDELIATWKLAEGITDGRCVTACFAAVDQLALHAAVYKREFGAAVNFRAGLHCGPVVAGEMGSVKKEIVFLGDTVNTAARIQEFCRHTGDRILASANLVDQLVLPPGIGKRFVGDLRLRGKAHDVTLYALTRAMPSGPPQRTKHPAQLSRAAAG
jgi:adenylate cyclase